MACVRALAKLIALMMVLFHLAGPLSLHTGTLIDVFASPSQSCPHHLSELYCRSKIKPFMTRQDWVPCAHLKG